MKIVLHYKKSSKNCYKTKKPQNIKKIEIYVINEEP